MWKRRCRNRPLTRAFQRSRREVPSIMTDLEETPTYVDGLWGKSNQNRKKTKQNMRAFDLVSTSQGNIK